VAKIHVVNTEQDSTTPFLRGILTRSLQEAGLSFDAAYGLASDIRESLAENKPRVTNDELREQVRQLLRKRFGPEVEERYLATSRTPETIWIQESEEQRNPFSRGQLRGHLESCGLGAMAATAATNDVFTGLVQDGIADIGADELGLRIHRMLEQDYGKAAAQRYLVWTAFRRSDRPLLLLIGGVAGSGKSTIATEIAHRLEIVRTQPVDMLREVMRMMIPPRLLPALHASSFTAWQELPGRPDAPSGANHAALVEDGFRAQAQLLSVACEAVIQRTLTERDSLILEGVHVLPGLRELIPADSDAIVVPVMLSVLKPSTLRARFRGRGRQVATRYAERYLDHFDDIWLMQSFLLSEADHRDVAIINNEVLERTVQQVLRTIIETLARERKFKPAEVFAP